MEQTRTIKVPVYLLEKERKVYWAISTLHKDLGRKPTPEEIGKKINTSVKFINLFLNAEKDVTSLDSPIKDRDRKTFLDFVVDESTPAPDSLSDKEELKVKIREALTLLTPREDEIVRLRYGIDLEDRFTLDEIGKMFGRTRERIRQIEKAALEKIAQSEMGEVLEDFLR